MSAAIGTATVTVITNGLDGLKRLLDDIEREPRQITPAERVELDRVIAESAAAAHRLATRDEGPLAAAERRKQLTLAQCALEKAEREDLQARQSLSNLEAQAFAARENGNTMPAPFWDVFSNAVKTVRVAERDVCRAREKVR